MANKKIKITAPVGAAPFFMGLFIGDVVELDEKQAEILVESGRAVYLTPQETLQAAPQAIEITETASAKTSPETATSKPQRKRK